MKLAAASFFSYEDRKLRRGFCTSVHSYLLLWFFWWSSNQVIKRWLSTIGVCMLRPNISCATLDGDETKAGLYSRQCSDNSYPPASIARALLAVATWRLMSQTNTAPQGQQMIWPNLPSDKDNSMSADQAQSVPCTHASSLQHKICSMGLQILVALTWYPLS